LSVGEGQRLTEAAVLLCGHGSRDCEAIAEFELVAAALHRCLPQFDVVVGYLEFARPTIRDGLVDLAGRGVRQIFAIPGMLLAANHVKRDLPREINTFAAENREVDVRLGRDLSIGPWLRRAAADRIAAAAQDPAIPRAESLLVVVGRGVGDPDANSNISELTHRLWDEMGFGWAEVAFSGAPPRVDAVLTRSARLGFRRIIVFPYFLLTGVLVKQIYAQADAAARLFPEIEFVKAFYLRDHPEVLGAFHDRVREVCDRDPAGPCQR
jgi:sirohydrochlorin cobaltochelatase